MEQQKAHMMMTKSCATALWICLFKRILCWWEYLGLATLYLPLSLYEQNMRFTQNRAPGFRKCDTEHDPFDLNP